MNSFVILTINIETKAQSTKYKVIKIFNLIFFITPKKISQPMKLNSFIEYIYIANSSF